jgi:ubiquinone/menaquinone biosynthesis C-methylase UbiE
MPGHPVFAAVYDRLMASTETAGMRDLRAELLADASGRVLELGAGTGLNLDHYGAGVTELVLTEPDPHMAKRLRRKAGDAGKDFDVTIVEAGAERLPFEDEGFDRVVATLVFCTVPDAEAAVSEAHRVLKPDGRLLLLEHVRAEREGRLSRWQDRLERPWGWLAAGCHPNRDTLATLRGDFDVSGLRRDSFPGHAPPLVKPLVKGAAAPSAAE